MLYFVHKVYLLLPVSSRHFGHLVGARLVLFPSTCSPIIFRKSHQSVSVYSQSLRNGIKNSGLGVFLRALQGLNWSVVWYFQQKNQLADVMDDMDFSHDDVCSGRVPGIASLRRTTGGSDDSSNAITCTTDVELSADVDAKSCACLLQFLYTGLIAHQLHNDVSMFKPEAVLQSQCILS